MIPLVVVHHHRADQAAVAGIDQRLEAFADDAPPDALADLFRGPVDLADVARQRGLHPARRDEVGQGGGAGREGVEPATGSYRAIRRLHQPLTLAAPARETRLYAGFERIDRLTADHY